MLARAQDGTLLVARLLLAAALLPTGIARALNVSGFALTLAGAGMPFPNGVATAAVVVQVFGPLALILGVLPRAHRAGARRSSPAVTAFVLHPFWYYVGPAALAERTLMLADLGLAGGFLMYALTGPGALELAGLARRDLRAGAEREVRIREGLGKRQRAAERRQACRGPVRPPGPRPDQPCRGLISAVEGGGRGNHLPAGNLRAGIGRQVAGRPAPRPPR
ncbi:DoxX family membrane protein [Methylobacterium oryzae CBMB20]